MTFATVTVDNGAALAPAPPPAPASMAGSRLPAPRAVKTKRLRRAHGAVLTAAPGPASAPAIGAGGGSSRRSADMDGTSVLWNGDVTVVVAAGRARG